MCIITFSSILLFSGATWLFSYSSWRFQLLKFICCYIFLMFRKDLWLYFPRGVIETHWKKKFLLMFDFYFLIFWSSGITVLTTHLQNYNIWVEYFLTAWEYIYFFLFTSISNALQETRTCWSWEIMASWWSLLPFPWPSRCCTSSNAQLWCRWVHLI